MSRATRLRREREVTEAPKCVQAGHIVAAQECAAIQEPKAESSPRATGFPCPACQSPTRVVRTSRRAVGVDRKRVCEKCGHTVETTEREKKGALVRDMRISIADLVLFAESQFTNIASTPNDRSEDKK